MKSEIRDYAKSIRNKIRHMGGEYRHPLVKVKKQLIDQAFRRYNINSMIDCGACWGVHGGYTFHALSHYNLHSAIILDTHLTETTKKRASSFNNLKLLTGDLGDPQLVGSLKKVDAVILFDVLLHQVNPDWDQIIKMYSMITDHFIIYNQMFIGAEETIRLIDLGLDKYLENTPYNGQEEFIHDFFSKFDQKHPDHNKLYRDVHHYWQWGITPPDMISVAWRNNFRADYIVNYGNAGNLPLFENHGFLFSKIDR